MERFKYAAAFLPVMERNVFLEFVGDTPVNRLLDFLLTGRDFDYTLTDLAKKAGISWSTLHRIFPRFVKNKIVVQIRQIGRAKLYKLNQNNPIVQKFVALYDTILLQQLAKIEEKEIITV
ncbi:Uncharacterised protein [uncultured archaeon]|nr:Uncharacterised protein [uncultured archaeon]